MTDKNIKETDSKFTAEKLSDANLFSMVLDKFKKIYTAIEELDDRVSELESRKEKNQNSTFTDEQMSIIKDIVNDNIEYNDFVTADSLNEDIQNQIDSFDCYDIVEEILSGYITKEDFIEKIKELHNEFRMLLDNTTNSYQEKVFETIGLIVEEDGFGSKVIEKLHISLDRFEEFEELSKKVDAAITVQNTLKNSFSKMKEFFKNTSKILSDK